MTTIMIMGMYLGLKVVTLPKFEPDMFIKALTTYRPTLLNLVPPLCNFLAADPSVKSQHLSSVKFVTGGAAPFGPTMISNFMKKAAPNVPKFQEGFGMTESSPVTHVQPLQDSLLGGCGFPVPNTMAKIIDLETGELLPAGVDGELCVSGPQVDIKSISSYLKGLLRLCLDTTGTREPQIALSRMAGFIQEIWRTIKRMVNLS